MALSALYTMLDAFRASVADADVVALRASLQTFAEGAAGGAVTNAAGIAAHLGGNGRYVLADGASFEGRAGAPAGATAAAAHAAMFNAAGAQAFATYSLDSAALMRDLLAVVRGLTTGFQGLVAVRYPGTASGAIHLDFSGLRGLVQGLMTDVRQFLDLFRPHISKATMAKYEDKTNAGSLYWLEEHLLDGLVQGRPDDMSQPEDARTKTLEWVSRTVNRSFVALTGYNRFSLAGAAAGAAGAAAGPAAGDGGEAPLDPAASPAHYEQFGRLLCGAVFYDAAADANSGVAAGTAPVAASGLAALISIAKPRAAAAGLAPAAVLPVAGAGGAADNRIALWGDQPGLAADRSMLFNFNQLLAKYLGAFYDATSGKIYRALVDGFANGSFSRSVMTPGNSLPDLVVPGTGFGRRGDPTATGVLCESLALVLQRLAHDINPATQASDHLVATLSEVPLYVRESLLANVPVFVKLFELVQQEGELLKQVMSQTRIQCGRPLAPGAAAGGPAAGVVAVVGGAAVTAAATGPFAAGSVANSVEPLAAAPGDSAGTKAVLVRVIDAVAGGCYTLANAGAEVLRELADEPRFLQTQANSIEEYRARYGKMPLMPLSSALTFFQGVAAGGSRLFPEHSSGDPNFKLMYGTRKLLGRPSSKFTLADAPGVGAILAAFDGAAAEREKVGEARLDGFVGRAVEAVRFLVDTRHYKSALAAPAAGGDLFRVALAAPAAGGRVGIVTAGPGANAAYAVRVTPQETLAVTESSAQEQEMKKISDAVGGGSVALGGDRAKEWIYNIIDMNIIPINVHALMRGIPLAPLYNYVFTFEQMACLMLGETVGHVDGLAPDAAAAGGVQNTRQMMLKLMMDPYAELNVETYGNLSALHHQGAQGLVQRIFRGDDSLMMGRPKFLSDQMYNKALFGSLIPTPASFDETGPPGAGRMDSASAMPMADQAGAAPGAALVAPGANAQWGIPGTARAAAAVPRGLPTAAARRGASVFGALTFIGDPAADGAAASALKVVQLGDNAPAKLAHLESVGKARFDTRLSRNLFFMTNVQRLLRLKMAQDLTQYNNVLVSNHSVVDPGVTEYGRMPPSAAANAGLRRFGPANETEGSRRYNSDSRFVH